MAAIRIGISGWRYTPWRKVFYPPQLPQRAELEFASRHFRTIEINGSFYSLQRPEYYAAWRDETPPGFVFAVKGGRFITHMKKLRDVDEALANFFAIERWAGRIECWSRGAEPDDAERISARAAPPRAARDVYAYFDNDIKVHAPFDALALQRQLALPVWQADAPLLERRRPGPLRVREAPRSAGFVRPRSETEPR